MNKALYADFQEFSEDGKLYAADSLNNLNKLKLCPNESQDLLDTSDILGQDCDGGKQPLLTVLIITVAAMIILSTCIMSILVQIRSAITEVEEKLDIGEQEISKTLVLLLNLTKV
ncbi:leucine-rich single-pass membrane protein 1 [Spea bombifrons]|uniref:leucine-rich single-pass membrane protein 1 n=1 Tax=Spea bombifrons TaxID=233779 RepID=UPI00234B0AE2|nr:leucine-rich single-pass membrane protein 1 [Spea bombifrons]